MSVESVIIDQKTLNTLRQRIKAQIAQVAGLYGVTYAEVMSKGQGKGGKHSRFPHKPIVQARFACMAMVRSDFHMSYPQIGRIFGKDHTTVIHAIERHEASKANQSLSSVDRT